MGEQGAIIYTSDAGLSWTFQQSGTSQPLYGASAAGDSFIAVGRGGIILRSKDTTTVSVDLGVDSKKPKKFELLQNYPNPFNPTTIIQYNITKTEYVNLKVYDVLGKEIETLVNDIKKPGNYEVTWNASNLSNGIYFYRLITPSFLVVKKMLLIK